MSRCEEVEPLLEEYRVDLLDPAGKRGIGEHLHSCARCLEAFEQIKRIEELLLEGKEAIELPTAEIRARMEQVHRRVTRMNRWKEVLPMAAAALVLVGILAWWIGTPKPEDMPVIPAQDRSVPVEENRLFTLLDGTVAQDLTFSPDGTTAAYKTMNRDGKWVVVVGETVGEEFTWIDDGPHFGPHGGTWWYIARLVNSRNICDRFIVVNGRKSEAYEKIWDISVVSDGSKVAYVAERGGFHYVVFGDWKSEGFDWVSQPVLSPDGKTLAYAAEQAGVRFVVVGDKRGEEFTEVSDPIFSPDGRTVSYSAKEGERGGYQVVVGNTRVANVWVQKEISNLCFRPDGTRLSYAALRDGKTWDLVTAQIHGNGSWSIEERVATKCKSIRLLGTSPDGRLLAWKGTDEADGNGQWRVQVEGEEGEMFDDIHAFLFRPDSKSFAYVAQMGKRMFVVQDSDRKKDKFERIGDLLFSPDGKTLAYIGHKSGKSVVIVGDQKSEEFDDAQRLTFTPDGKKVVFGARQGRELWWKVMEVK